jgi:hypothetical protein
VSIDGVPTWTTPSPTLTWATPALPGTAGVITRDAGPLSVRDLRALARAGLEAQLNGHLDRGLSRPQGPWWIGTTGSLHGQDFGLRSASDGTVCVSSVEDKEP